MFKKKRRRLTIATITHCCCFKTLIHQRNTFFLLVNIYQYFPAGTRRKVHHMLLKVCKEASLATSTRGCEEFRLGDVVHIWNGVVHKQL